MNRLKMNATVLAAMCLFVWSCHSKSDERAEKAAQTASDDPAELMEEEEDMRAEGESMPAAAMAPEPIVADGLATKAKKRDSNAGYGGKDKELGRVVGGAPGAGGGGAEQGPAPRAWFPETFLFNPLVITDDAGKASVSVKVPDRLTSWRVLGLAHSRNGSQAGATASFEGTLPAYVDPVVPSFLRVGDSVRIPVQLVNNTDEAMQTQLKVEVQGGTLESSSQVVTIAKRSSAVRFVQVVATERGELRLMARMGDSDMVVRTIDVLPTGQPIRQTRSGTLAAPRTLALVGAEAVDASKGVADLSVYPGALSLLRSEMSAAVHRGGVAEDAFALLIAGKAPELLASLGDTPDPEALRKLSITASQKVMKHARVLSIENAALIAEAARSHVGNPVLERLGDRAIATIERSQAPDGTCGGESGWTLQRLLVATADCSRAAHTSPNVTIRATGAFERNAKEIADPYTAAAILAANGASGALQEILRAQVLAAIEERDDGAKVLVVPSGVVRADGRAPSVVEATALAVLALDGVADAPLADLGATILANYAPHWGWGDGRANLVCMEAAVQLFKDPLPDVVRILLKKDGDIVAEGKLEKSSVREVVRLGADSLEISGEHEWSVVAEPAVPGLGFSLALTSWVPWTAQQALGTELAVEPSEGMSVGKAAALSVQAIAPSGMPFQIKLALPAGVQLDNASLDAMVQSGSLRSYDVADGQVTLEIAALEPAKRFSGSLRVIPTLAGKLQSGPTMITVGRESGHLPPLRFDVKPAGS
jgi:hypothetical protein